MARIGIVADTISEDFDRATAVAADWGLTHIELYRLWQRGVWDLADDEIERAVDLVRARGLTVTNLDTLIMRCSPTDEAERQELTAFERAVVVARRFGTDRIRCYGYLKQPDLQIVWARLARTYEGLLRLAETHRVTLLFENSSYANVQTARELRRFLDTLDHPRLQLLWDAGNAFALGDPTPTADAWHLLKDRIAHLHIKDSVAHGSNRWVPVGRGALDLGGLLAAIAADKFAGTISLEPYFSADEDDREREQKVHDSLQGLRDAATGAGLWFEA
jgi:sugar phosphate isomerase/epimerase